MIGPLFNQELLLGSRRTRDHVFRWIYASWLVFQVMGLAALVGMGLLARPFDERQMFTPMVCRRFAEVFIQQHMVLLLLATPVFVAGALTDEKTRGTLQYLLTTDLTSGQVILGKLCGRVIQVLSLALAGLPLLCFLGALGGVELTLILGLVLVTLFVVTGVAAATLLAAVWSRQTRDAVLGLFLALLLVYHVYRDGDWSFLRSRQVQLVAAITAVLAFSGFVSGIATDDAVQLGLRLTGGR